MHGGLIWSGVYGEDSFAIRIQGRDQVILNDLNKVCVVLGINWYE